MMKSFFVYVYRPMKTCLYSIYIVLLFLVCSSGYSQEIRLEHKTKPDKFKTVRLDKPLMVKTFEGEKIKGMASIPETGKLLLDGKEIELENVMTLSGFVIRNSKEKAVGLGLSIGAGVIAIPALYYILGGIAWGVPNGIFVGATILVFDLFLAYVGTSLMGIYPKKFSTMNWNIATSPESEILPETIPAPITLPLPQPHD